MRMPRSRRADTLERMKQTVVERLALDQGIAGRPKRTLREDVVARALDDGRRGGLSLNEINERCGGTMAETSRALIALEIRGCAHFAGGRWTALPRRF
jgi:predicted Rossmann fold nucleotide-binding protein DprA/Smf involved in DNA uptake